MDLKCRNFSVFGYFFLPKLYEMKIDSFELKLEISVSKIFFKKISDFSTHKIPTKNKFIVLNTA